MDLEELYEKLLKYCYSKTHDRHLAEDIVQDTFVRFYSNHTYKETGKKLAYLYIIARNLCIDSYRRPQIINIDEVKEDVELRTATNSETDEALDRMSAERALACLSEEDRELVLLRYNQELSNSDIGEIMGMSRWAVHRRLQKCLKQMREELEGGSNHDKERIKELNKECL